MVRGAEGLDAFRDDRLEVAAGIRQPLARYVAGHPELRLLEPRFMEIRQAVAITKDRRGLTITFLHELIESLKANGFVEAAVTRSGQDATVAPPSSDRNTREFTAPQSVRSPSGGSAATPSDS